MKIKALRSISGAYGMLNEGQTTNVSSGLANELSDAGLVEIVGEAEEGEAEADAEKERIKGSTVKVSSATKKVKG